MPAMFSQTHAAIVFIGVACTAICGVYAFSWHVTRDTKNAWLLSLASIATVLFGVWFFRLYSSAKPSLESERPQLVEDLVQVFKGNEFSAKHAELFGEICLITKSKLEIDGTRSVPKIATGEQQAELRKEVVYFHLSGKSMSDTYPNLPAVVGEFLTDEAGDDKGLLTPDKRAAWVQAYHHLGIAAIKASEQL